MTYHTEQVSTPSSAVADLAIQVQGLVKRYGQREVIRGLSFAIHKGELFALLGPNGAGKTTTIEILEGYRQPDAGTVRVLGLDPWLQGAQLKQQIGIMLQSGGVYPAATPKEILELFATFYPEPEDPDAVLRLVGLEEVRHTRYRHLSGGQQRRLALALALIGKPRLLFLDEPTTGMDPQARRLTWLLIENLKHRGITIVLTTHFLEEAERLADRVAIIDYGQLIALATIRDLLQLDANFITVAAAQELDSRALMNLPGVEQVRKLETGRYALETHHPKRILAELTRWALAQDILLTEIRVGHSSLEDVFLRLTGERVRE